MLLLKLRSKEGVQVTAHLTDGPSVLAFTLADSLEGAAHFDAAAWLEHGYGNQGPEGFVLYAEGLLGFSARQATLLDGRLRRAFGQAPVGAAGPRSRLSPLAVSERTTS